MIGAAGNSHRHPAKPATRRLVLKTAIASLGAAALYAMDRLALRAGEIPENSSNTVTLAYTPGPGIHFYDEAIVVTSEQNVAVFSSACPHLGCRINRAEAGAIVCPCHGSRFAADGSLLHGPAARGLRPLPFQLDKAAGRIHITLDSPAETRL